MRDGPVRVLRVIARLNAGGPAHHVGILSSRLADRGYETLLVHGRVARGEEMLGRFDERYPTQRRELDVLGREPRPIDDVLSLWQLIRSVRSFRPAIVHTHTAKAGVLGRIAALAIRPRPVVVHTYHGHVFHGYFGRLTSAAYRRVEQALSLVTDCLVAVSDATARDLRRLGVGTPDKIRVVRLGLDLEPFAGSPPEGGRSLRRLVGAQERDLLAVTIGRLVHIKRIDLALSAVAEAVALGVPVRLVVVGDGPLRPELEARAGDLGVADRVTFLGYRSDLDVIAAAADVALLTSDAEGTPVSLIEMGASGRPAIATDVGGVREVVTDASGLVVPAGNASAIAQALATLAEDADRRREMGRAARQHTTSRFGASRLLDDVDVMYRELLNPHATSPRG